MIDTTFIIPLSQLPPISEIKGKYDNTNIGSAVNNDSQMSFSDTLRQKIQNVKNLEQKSLDSAYDVSMGKTENIEGAMIDATRASVAIETAVQITTRAVNAYKEIMQMQI